MDDKIQQIFDGIAIYQNKKESNKKQYNLALDKNLMNRINKSQQGLQVLLDSYIGKGEMIENILRRGLNSLEAAISIDNTVYTFSDLENRYTWISEDFFNKVMQYLTDFNVLEDIINNVTMYVETGMCDITEEIKNKIFIKKEDNIIMNIEGINIEEIDKVIIELFINELHDYFIMKGNEYHTIRNLKYINNIIPFEDVVKVALHFYKEIKFVKEKYEKLQKIIRDYNPNVNDKDIIYVIVDTAMYYTKIVYGVIYNPDNVEGDKYLIESNTDSKLDGQYNYQFKTENFKEDNLLKNRSFKFMLKQKLNEYGSKHI